jgi:RNA polymerase sigma-70 factor, ECF subfamily
MWVSSLLECCGTRQLLAPLVETDRSGEHKCTTKSHAVRSLAAPVAGERTIYHSTIEWANACGALGEYVRDGFAAFRVFISRTALGAVGEVVRGVRESPRAQSEHGMDRDDSRLAAHAKDDRQAFAELYARYVDAVYAFCRRRSGSAEEAEDATSQVFCQALAALPRYRGGSFAAWLFAIARHVCADRWRRHRPEQPLAAGVDIVDGAATPEECALLRDGERSVDALLACLPEEQRQVVELRLAGLTGAEVAQVLGTSLGAVRMRQFRAATRLRSLVDRQDEAQEVRHANG